MTRRRRTTRIIRLVALAGIVVGPIIRAHFQTRPLRTETVDPSAYIAARSSLIERLLPAGAGGTHFVATLGGPAGVTHPGNASILLLVPGDAAAGAMIELHERAHLLESFEWRAVEKIMAQLPAPVAGSYAATSATEHFAEMAASACETTPSLGLYEVDWSVEPARLARAELRRIRMPNGVETSGMILHGLQPGEVIVMVTSRDFTQVEHRVRITAHP